MLVSKSYLTSNFQITGNTNASKYAKFTNAALNITATTINIKENQYLKISNPADEA